VTSAFAFANLYGVARPRRAAIEGSVSTAARFAAALAAFIFAPLGAGCLSTNSPQLERCQTEKKQLLSRLVDEQKRGESLTTELRTANQRLADAEKQLARVVGGAGGSRLASASELGNSTGTPLLSNTAGDRPLQLGAPRDNQFISAAPRTSGSPGATGTTGTSGSAGQTTGTVGTFVDTRGFDRLAPSNGRSESGWMPRSPANSAGPTGNAPTGPRP
jgi:hypothetical protein